MSADDGAIGVRELMARVSDGVDRAVGRGVLLRGEVVSVHRHASSGHVYFDLTDGGGTVASCAMWKVWAGARDAGSDRLCDGAMVTVQLQRASVYPKKGSLTLHVRRVVECHDSVGARRRRRDALAARLVDEGLMDAPSRRALPRLARVGVVTSLGSAAHADFCSGVDARWRGYDVVYRHAAMQGDGAPDSIVEALSELVDKHSCGVVVLTRGGGSEHDLDAFDDESVVRAVAGCAVPTVVAVGHETDTGLADRVCDLRAKTPTAAAELVIPSRSAEEERLDAARRRLEASVAERVRAAREAHARRVQAYEEAARSSVSDARRAVERARCGLSAACAGHTARLASAVASREARLVDAARTALLAASKGRGAARDLLSKANAAAVRRASDALDARRRAWEDAVGAAQSRCLRAASASDGHAVVVVQDGSRKRRRDEVDASRDLLVHFSDGTLRVRVLDVIATRDASLTTPRRDDARGVDGGAGAQ